MSDDTFVIEGEDLVFKIEWDSEPASGDGWDEPRQPARAWVHRLWYATKPVFEDHTWTTKPDGTLGHKVITRHTDGDGWVEMDPAALRPSMREALDDECRSRAFPEEDY